MLAVIYVFGICVYVLGICVVATILFVAVDDLEPNRRYALAFKFLPRLCELLWQSHED